MVKFARNYGFLLVLCVLSLSAWSDTLELRNGSVIKGKFVSRTDIEISFQVGSSVQKYSVADVVSLKFDNDGASGQAPTGTNESKGAEQNGAKTAITVPAGTRISVRTIDGI